MWMSPEQYQLVPVEDSDCVSKAQLTVRFPLFSPFLNNSGKVSGFYKINQS